MWRMHLVICKRLRSAVPAAIIILFSFLLNAEGVKSSSTTTHKGTLDTTLSMPGMPLITGISSPSMPVISAPTLGSSFYKPGENSPDSSPVSAGTAATENTSSGKKSAASVSAAPAADSTAELSQDGISALSSSVSASDLNSLQSSGLLGNLYSILGNSSGTANPLSTAAGSTSTDSLLTDILQQLKELKQKNKSTFSADKTAASTDVANNSAARTDSSQPAILRFVVNGYDILSTCRTTYFSNQENDGTFLLTGDRKYTSDGRTRNETFYLLFKTTGSTGFSTQYAVEPAVVQDYANKYSFVYQLAHMQNLSAAKTGNLVTMRLNEPTYNMDLLIDIGSKAK
jgi:hypothetical protein